MLRKIRAIVNAGILGAGTGVVVGSWIWLLSWFVSGPGRVLPFGRTVLEAGLLGTLAGTLFAIGLTLYARVGGTVALSKRLATVLGASAGALAFPLVVVVRELPVSHWTLLNWIVVLATCAYLGSRAGGLLWSVAGEGEKIMEESSAPDRAAIQAPSILDGSSSRWAAPPEHQSSPPPESRSPTLRVSDRAAPGSSKDG